MATKLPIVLRTNTLGSEELRANDNLSAGGTRLVDVAAPIDGTDAVNLDFLNTAINVAAFNVLAADISHWNTAYSWGNHAGLYDPVGTASATISSHETTYDHTDIWGAGAEDQLWTQGADGNPVSEANLTFDGTILKSPQYGSPNHIYLVPTGTGCIQNSAYGNARGQYAVDLQGSRTDVNQVASGNYSTIAGGINNRVTGAYSSIGGGSTNYVVGTYSTVAGGQQNQSTGDYYCTIVGGYQNTAAGTFTLIIGGRGNQCTGDANVSYNVICGGYYNKIDPGTTTLYGSNFIGGGYQCEIMGVFNTVAGGRGNKITIAAGTTYSTIGGGYNNTTNSNSVIIAGGHSNTITTSNYSTISGGQSNTIPTDCGTHNVIGGGYSNTTVAAATNNGSNVIAGGYDNSIQGQRCVIGGGSSNDITIAAGALYSTIAGGYANDITNDYSTIGGGRQILISSDYGTAAGGYNHDVTGDYGAISGGRQNTASGEYSSIPGGYLNTASANYSTACGYTSVANKHGQFSQSAGKFAENGDAQTSILVAKTQTTDDTPTEIVLSLSTDRLTIPINTSWFFTVKVIARQINDDFSVNAYHIEGTCSRDAGNIAIDYQTTITSNEEDATWDFVISADTGNQSLKLLATGAVDNTINWVARIELVEVTG